MIVRIGMFILATCWMFSAAFNNGFDDKLIAMLLYFIIVLLASKKEN